VAAAAAAFAKAHGGALMAEADFNAYQPEWVGTVQQDYRGHTLHEIPPNGQGIAALHRAGHPAALRRRRAAGRRRGQRSTCRSRP
jgi:gamma-glutamyltranspeptidase/glutathione hydrolase